MSSEVMEFPATFDEFVEQYKIVDRKEVYTNGAELIPVFRVRQWLERVHPNTEEKQIEEMACTLAKIVLEKHNELSMLDFAKAIYAAGYRKQVIGEWIENKKICSSPYCSICGAIGGKGNFCHYCGAKMKGSI